MDLFWAVTSLLIVTVHLLIFIEYNYIVILLYLFDGQLCIVELNKYGHYYHTNIDMHYFDLLCVICYVHVWNLQN